MGTMPMPGRAPSSTRPRVPLAEKSWVGRLLRQFKLQLSRHQQQCHQVVQARNRPQLLTVVPVAVVLVVVVVALL